jgi:3-phosphoshikimate 1-carboxyvinyltransferase
VIQVGEAGDAAPRLVSRPLIDQTLETMGRFGLALRADFEALRFFVPGGQCGQGGDVAVHGDWPSAAALLSTVAVAGGMATLYGLYSDAQGERRAMDWLASAGCEFDRPRDEQLMIHGKGRLRATDLDGDLATDAVLALVGAACVAEGTSRFTNIANLRLKESDRIREPLEELARLGVAARSGEDWIEITGRPEGYEGGIVVDARGDHRVAQMLSIVGVRCAKGLTIHGAQSIAKSYPEFFDDLERLGVKLVRIPVAG